MRLRQIALVAQDLAAAQADIAAVLGLDYAYDDPGVGKYGLRNAVFPIGDTFLEVVSPKEPGTTAGRLLEKRGGDGGYMVILQVDDLAEALARVKNAAARIADQMDKDGAAFTHIHPKDIGGAILSLDRMVPKERWEWGGPQWQSHVCTDTSVKVAGAEQQAKDPARMAARWAQVLGRAASEDAGVWRIRLDDGEIRFTVDGDGRGEGLGAFDVVVRDVEAVRATAAARGLLDRNGTIVLAGTRVRVHACD
ncbi:MAG TPA: VOC family protein [Steroidobacteraceae bacterium]|nr:VOC family protein [Steroidobacteraceae bacterium]